MEPAPAQRLRPDSRSTGLPPSRPGPQEDGRGPPFIAMLAAWVVQRDRLWLLLILLLAALFLGGCHSRGCGGGGVHVAMEVDSAPEALLFYMVYVFFWIVLSGH
jgi:hypothetical protein